MLGRLFSSAAGHGRSPSSLESTTEERHTRNLLFLDAPLSSSPPSQGSAAGLRLGNFDDQNGFTIEDKDLRILIAQEDQERPTILFDTNISRGRGEYAGSLRSSKAAPSIKHERTASSVASSKSYFGSQAEITTSSVRSAAGAVNTRSRGSTMSGGQHNPPLPYSRDTESKDFDLLECMFGASSTKSGTKIHLIKSGNKNPILPSSPLASPAPFSSRTVRKPPSARAQTSNPISTDAGHASCDMVLITRIFTVAPPEDEKDMSESASKSTATLVEESGNPPGRSKPPKLRESKYIC